MAKVILQIGYEIDPEKREEYLLLAAELKEHFAQTQKKNYQIFELKGKRNSFVEQFICSSMEEYEALEDDLDEKGDDLVNRLEVFLKERKAKYTTLVEV